VSADALLQRLDGVRRTGPGRWIARCPAHDDRHASLSIRVLDDGRTLLHDFTGCSVEEVLAAAGLTMEALFPERPIGDHVKRERRPFNAHDVLACCEFEALVVATAASNIAAGEPLSDVGRERLTLAAERLAEARRLASGR
jgi:hypothetical protein